MNILEFIVHKYHNLNIWLWNERRMSELKFGTNLSRAW